MEFRRHTLDNGLEIIAECSPNAYSMGLAFFVKAGARDETPENAGVSHFLEHMVFKGTHKIGTADWEKEKVYLKKISDLYEKHRAEKDPKKKITKRERKQ